MLGNVNNKDWSERLACAVTEISVHLTASFLFLLSSLFFLSALVTFLPEGVIVGL